MNEVEAVLVDLSGTIHIEDTAIPGAQDALQKLYNHGIKVKFVTNTTKEPIRLLHNRLTDLNFKISKSDIFTSLTAARSLIEKKKVQPLLLLEECAKEDFQGIPTDNPNAVVVGLAPSCFDYSHMNQAFRLLLTGAPFIAIHKARYYKKKDGLYLGPGGFVTGLEYATDTKAEVVGKPEQMFFLQAIEDLGVDPKNTVMIGDDVRDDVGGAIAAGMKGILVKTGKYLTGDEDKINPKPTFVAESFPGAVDYILSKQ